MIPYAQNCEDVLLRRAFRDLRSGFYIDVGANDPFVASVTKHFSLEGWRGINIEPQVELYQKICEDRPNDVNLNVGVSDRASEIDFMQCLSNAGLSTFSTELWERLARSGLEFVKRNVPVTTLTEICEAHVRGPIDFLKIDAEGFEREVILGNDWSRWRPRIVVVAVPVNHVMDNYIRRHTHEHVALLQDAVTNLRRQAADLKSELARVRASAACAESGLAEARQVISRDSVLGPNALRIAHRLHNLSLKHPRLARTVLNVVGMNRR